ncbi:MAG: hypothetical protein A2X35_09985 [Elusimicrobia bacterium GWA2_61_42]|nr:MAG: hypothetical protein A2X35_09985 [Elusimicrobia bacterium GWA2_61_42]OGR74881.1 MAG: hypothetical protein A2X38_08900 [Elusimicrobia bacterium GWC2_61_25]
MNDDREKPFYVMVFLSLLLAGGVFILASAVTMDRLRYFSVPRHYITVFHRALGDAFSNFGAATGAGASSAAGKLKTFAAGLAARLYGNPVPAGLTAGRGHTPTGAGDAGDRGRDPNLFGFSVNMMTPGRSPGRNRAGDMASEPGFGAAPGTIPVPSDPRHASRKDKRTPPGAAPGPVTGAAPGPAADTGAAAPRIGASERREAPGRTAPGAAGTKPKSGAELDWAGDKTARNSGQDPDRGEFNLDSLKAGAVKKSAAPGREQQAKPAPAPGGGREAAGGAAGAGAKSGTGAAKVLKDLAARTKASDDGSLTASAASPKTPKARLPASPAALPGGQDTTAEEAGEGELTSEETEEINAILLKSLKSIENGYGPMATLEYTPCETTPLCGEHGLQGGFLTMTTEPGAMIQLAVKKIDAKWESYTIDFRPPPL